MESGFRKDVFAIAVGTFLGAMLAHSLGYLWYLGVACGGFMGYLSRLLTEPYAITSAGKRAWHRIESYHLPIGWQGRAKFAFYSSVSIGSPGGVGLAVLLVFLNLFGAEPGKAAIDLKAGSSLELYVIWSFVVPIFLLWYSRLFLYLIGVWIKKLIRV